MSRSPIVYDIALRIEMEAKDETEALELLKLEIDCSKFKNMEPKFEIIRDDNLFNGAKDITSRAINGFVLLTSAEKHVLLDSLALALEAGRNGDFGLGEELLNKLRNRFDYLEGKWRPIK